MNRFLTKQMTLALMALAIACLASAVFLWGTGYKCSLYHKHPERHPRIAIAKLLSERERPSADGVISMYAPLPPAVFFAVGILLTGFYRMARPGFNWVLQVVRNETTTDRISCLIHFSFRPPPAMTA